MAVSQVTRRVVGMVMGGTLGLTLVLVANAPNADADIFKRVDRFGTIHYTNVPVDKRFYRVVIREIPRISAGAGAGAVGGTSAVPWFRVGPSSFSPAESRAFDPIIATVARRY